MNGSIDAPGQGHRLDPLLGPIILLSLKDTTRPRKSHEREGVEYHFVSKQAFEADIQHNKCVASGASGPLQTESLCLFNIVSISVLLLYQYLTPWVMGELLGRTGEGGSGREVILDVPFSDSCDVGASQKQKFFLFDGVLGSWNMENIRRISTGPAWRPFRPLWPKTKFVWWM